MKRLLGIFFVLLMLTAACGGGDAGSKDERIAEIREGFEIDADQAACMEGELDISLSRMKDLNLEEVTPTEAEQDDVQEAFITCGIG